jgi:acetyltransferase-like isoleucine patch superfamily enzyme
MKLNKTMLDKLTRYGLNIDGNERTIPGNLVCELPVSLKRTEIGPDVKVGAYSYMVSGYLFATEIGRYCSIGEEVQIGRQDHPLDWVSTSPHFYLPGSNIQPVHPYFSNHLRKNYYKHGVPATTLQHTSIGHNVWIGHGAIIKAGVSIGNGAIIASGAVVTKDVLPYSIVGGNPAKFIRYRISEDLIEKLEKTAWWKYSPKQLEIFQMHDIENFIENFNRTKLKENVVNSIHLNLFNFKGKKRR